MMRDASDFLSNGRHARQENRLPAARAYYAEAAQILRDQNQPLAYAHAIRHIADMYLDEAHLGFAKPLYEESLEIYRSSLETQPLDLANTLRPYAILNEQLGDLEAAAKLWQEAANLYSSMRIAAGVEECEKRLANLR